LVAARSCARIAEENRRRRRSRGHTIDQIIAQMTARNAPAFGRDLVEDPGSGSSNCGEGYSCVYTNTIAWSSPTNAVADGAQPAVVFERMFGSGSTPEQRVARRERSQASGLDQRKIATLRREISVPDRSRLDSFIRDVREIERRLTIAASGDDGGARRLRRAPGIRSLSTTTSS